MARCGVWLCAGLLLSVDYITLVELHAPDGRSIYVNVEEITSLRQPARDAGDHFAPGTQCVLVLSNKSISAVRESCAEVVRMVGWPPT